MQHELLLQQITERLKPLQGIQAIVLGGSYASKVQRTDSDLDIGLLYYENQPLDLSEIRELAVALNDTPDPIVTAPGDWGPWVNGGAWLTIQGQRVDLLYRNIDLVSATLDACNAGHIRSDYWQQPAYGFHSFMYCTEIAICQPLYDPEHILEQLKARVATYSTALKQTIKQTFLWQARFTLDNIRKPARRGEVYMVAGGLTRVAHCLVQVLYALNETYYISEKQLKHDIQAFALQPVQFLSRIELLLSNPGQSSAQLEASWETMETLYTEIQAL